MEDRAIHEPAAGTKTANPGIFAKTFSSLRHANYRYLWIGTVFMSAHWIGAPATVSYMGIAVISMAGLVAWRAPVVRDLGVSREC